MPFPSFTSAVRWPDDSPRSALLLLVIAMALLSLIILVTLVNRVGSAVATEVGRAQSDYLRGIADRPGAIDNALRFGQCLRREMRIDAIEGMTAPSEWAQRQRARAEAQCHSVLEPLTETVPERRRPRIVMVANPSLTTTADARGGAVASR